MTVGELITYLNEKPDYYEVWVKVSWTGIEGYDRATQACDWLSDKLGHVVLIESAPPLDTPTPKD